LKLVNIIFLELIIFTTPFFALTNNDKYDLVYPEPKGGLELLKDSIEFPNIARKAGIETAFIAHMHIDSLGTVSELSFKPIFSDSLYETDSIMVNIVQKKLNSVKWKPAYIDGEATSVEFAIPFVFIFKSHKRRSYEFIKRGVLPVGLIKVEPIIINDTMEYIYFD
jgi:hypothetical protein